MDEGFRCFLAGALILSLRKAQKNKSLQNTIIFSSTPVGVDKGFLCVISESTKMEYKTI